MGTRSRIAVIHGTVCKSVYCHWDGYLEYNGSLLQKHYDSTKANQLVSLGDLSSLKPEIGEQHAFGYHGTDMDGETYEKLYGNMCTFYGRDRGESGTMQRMFKDLADYEQNMQHEEYAYVLRKDGYWYVKAYEGPFELLRDALSKCNVEECVA